MKLETIKKILIEDRERGIELLEEYEKEHSTEYVLNILILNYIKKGEFGKVLAYLEKLEKDGYIKKEDKKGRTLKIIKGSNGEPYVKSSKDFYVQKELVDVPVIGRITAGQPILAVENVTDTFPIPVDFVGNSESFMLTVRGESMIEAGILDGDYILVKKQSNANNGEIVVALIGDEATVKTFYKEKDHIRLQPENHTMDPIIVPDCRILGKVAGVFRKM